MPQLLDDGVSGHYLVLEGLPGEVSSARSNLMATVVPLTLRVERYEGSFHQEFLGRREKDF